MNTTHKVDTMQGICDGCERGCMLDFPKCGKGREIALERTILNEGGIEEMPARTQGDMVPMKDGVAIRPRGERKRGGRMHGHCSDGFGGGGHGRGERSGRGRGHGSWGDHEGHRFHDVSGAHRVHCEKDMSDDQILTQRFCRCAHLLMHRQGKGRGRLRVLSVLERHGAITQRELADRLDIRPASVSELLMKMESSGLVVRFPNPEDGRAVLVELSKSGHEQAKQSFAHRGEIDGSLFAALDDEEKEALGKILDKLICSWRCIPGSNNND